MKLTSGDAVTSVAVGSIILYLNQSIKPAYIAQKQGNSITGFDALTHFVESLWSVKSVPAICSDLWYVQLDVKSLLTHSNTLHSETTVSTSVLIALSEREKRQDAEAASASNAVVDDDVVAERERILRSPLHLLFTTDTVILRQLTKIYRYRCPIK